MHDASLFSIGFKCESIVEALKAYQTGTPIAPRRIDESLEVIDDCFGFMRSASSYFSQQGTALAEFMPLVFDVYPGMSAEQLTEELSKIREGIVRIKHSKEPQPIDHIVEFFQKVSLLCLRRNAKVAAGTPLFHA